MKVVDQAGTQQYTLAGIAKYAGQDDAAGAQVVAFAPDDRGRCSVSPAGTTRSSVVAAPGVSQSEVAANIRAALHDADVEVLTGAAGDRPGTRESPERSLAFLNTFLMMFGIVALLVGSFVIYNTFSITVAQRMRNARCCGPSGPSASRSCGRWCSSRCSSACSPRRSVSSSGIAMAKGIAAAFTVFGFELPSAGTVVKPATIAASMVVGTVVTVLAAYLPARKAGKVAPIAALRDVRARPDRHLEAPRRLRHARHAARRRAPVRRACPVAGSARSAWVRCSCSSASPCSARSSPARSPACSVRRCRGCGGWRARSPGRTRPATRAARRRRRRR